MRTRDIELGTAYATCDGAYVVPVDLDRAWARVYSENKYHVVNVGKTTTDPWGGCTANGQRLPRGVTPSDIGIKCEQFTPDRNGDPIEESGVIVAVNPRDIKGLWTEYMVLHGEIVRRAADRATWQRTRHDLVEEFHAAVRSAVPGITTSVTLRETYRGSVEPVREQFNDGEVRLSFSTKQQWDRIVQTLAHLGVPTDFDVTAARIREMLPDKEDPDED